MSSFYRQPLPTFSGFDDPARDSVLASLSWFVEACDGKLRAVPASATAAPGAERHERHLLTSPSVGILDSPPKDNIDRRPLVDATDSSDWLDLTRKTLSEDVDIVGLRANDDCGSPSLTRSTHADSNSAPGRRLSVATTSRRQTASIERPPQKRWDWLRDQADADGVRGLGRDKSTIAIPPAAFAAFSPFEKQFWSIKSVHADLVIMMRVGTFYNLFDADAEIGISVGLKMCGQYKANMLKCGCNKDAFEIWSARIVALGYSVGRVDEFPPLPGNREPDRRLVQIISPGTAIMGEDPAHGVGFLALVEGKGVEGNGVLGYCFFDAVMMQFVCGAVDPTTTALATLMARYSICEVVHSVGRSVRSILGRFRQQMRLTLRELERGRVGSADRAPPWPPVTVLERLVDHGGPQPERILQLLMLPPSAVDGGSPTSMPLVALGASVRYLKYLGIADNVLHSARYAPKACGSESGLTSMTLDADAIENLHLVRDADGGVEGSLLGRLDTTATHAGRRRLRSWILQPLGRPADIVARQTAVQMLAAAPAAVESFREALRGRSVDASAQLTRALLIKTADDQDPTAADEARITSAVTSLDRLLGAVDAFVGCGPTGGIVLATIRHAGVKAAGPMSAVVAAHHAWREQLPPDVPTRKRPKKGSRTVAESVHVEGGAVHLFRAVLQMLTRHSVHLMALADQAATLDALCALSTARGCPPGLSTCMPTVVIAGPAVGAPMLDLKRVWCPLPLATTGRPGGGRQVPNSLALGGTGASTLLLSGPNSGGKSTLMRAVALSLILAQIGAFVSAAEMSFSCVDRIFTRIGASDRIVMGSSTFMVEMNETAVMLRSSTASSLLILDEIGRGTSSRDGHAIADAVLRSITAPTGLQPRAIFSTHVHQLVRDAVGLDAIIVAHMGAEVASAGIRYLYMLKPGPAPMGSCGLHAARLAGFPSALIDTAEVRSKALMAIRDSRRALARSRVQQTPVMEAGGLTEAERLVLKAIFWNPSLSTAGDLESLRSLFLRWKSLQM